jgi:O-antigen/teichoic acid export membrane protein
LFSASNFLVNIMLARWLSPDDWGAFSVSFSIFLFLAGFQSALILEPMNILGPSRYPGNLSAYLKAQVSLHFRLISVLGFLLAAIGTIILCFQPESLLAKALLGAGLALPMVLFIWLVRTAFYMLQKPAGALLSSGLYSLILLVSFWFLHRQGIVSSFGAYLLMGLAGMIAGGLALWWGRGLSSAIRISLRVLLQEQWAFGKWIVAASFFTIIASQAQIILTAGMLNLESAGVLRALQYFIQPMVQATTAVALLAAPSLSTDFGQRKMRSLERKGLFIICLLAGSAVAYGLVLWAVTAPLEQIIYGGKFSAYDWLIPWAGMIPFFNAIYIGFSVILRAIQKPQHILIVGLAAAPVGLVSSLLLIPSFAVTGSIASLIITGMANMIVVAFLYVQWRPKSG